MIWVFPMHCGGTPINQVSDTSVAVLPQLTGNVRIIQQIEDSSTILGDNLQHFFFRDCFFNFWRILFASGSKIPETFRKKYSQFSSKIHILLVEFWYYSNLYTTFSLSKAVQLRRRDNSFIYFHFNTCPPQDYMLYVKQEEQKRKFYITAEHKYHNQNKTRTEKEDQLKPTKTRTAIHLKGCPNLHHSATHRHRRMHY